MKYDGNYIHKPLAITQHPQLTFAEQDYLCLISQLSNRNGCIASNAWFGRYFNVKPKRASEVICLLVRKGFIKTTEERKGKEVIKRTIEIIDQGTKESLAGVPRNHRIRYPETTGEGTKEIGEDKLNIKTKDKSKDKTKEIESLFEHFWTAYPKKVNKPQALKAFRKLNPDAAMVDAMLDAIDRQKYSEQWSKNDGQFIPYPATWLAGRRWEDPIEDSSTGCCMTREVTEEEAIELFRLGGLIQ